MKDGSEIRDLLDEIDSKVTMAYDRGYTEGCITKQKRTYEKGLDDAWEAARKIFDMLPYERALIFRDKNCMHEHTSSEAIAKIKEFEEKQKQADDEIRVGDEVIVQDNKVGFVTGIVDDTDEVYVTSAEGWSDRFEKMFVTRTGRHFPQIEEVLEQMQEDKE